MNEAPADKNVPSLFSVDFHARFFPGVVWRRVRPDAPTSSVFASHVRYELVIVLVICGALLAGAAPAAVTGAPLAVAIALAGAAGLIAVFVQSIRTMTGVRPEYERFHVSIFVLFLTAGIAAGLIAGREEGMAIRALMIAGGAVVGYGLGIVTGLWVQRLGWISSLLSVFALGATLGVLLLCFAVLS